MKKIFIILFSLFIFIFVFKLSQTFDYNNFLDSFVRRWYRDYVDYSNGFVEYFYITIHFFYTLLLFILFEYFINNKINKNENISLFTPIILWIIVLFSLFLLEIFSLNFLIKDDWFWALWIVMLVPTIWAWISLIYWYLRIFLSKFFIIKKLNNYIINFLIWNYLKISSIFIILSLILSILIYIDYNSKWTKIWLSFSSNLNPIQAEAIKNDDIKKCNNVQEWYKEKCYINFLKNKKWLDWYNNIYDKISDFKNKYQISNEILFKWLNNDLYEFFKNSIYNSFKEILKNNWNNINKEFDIEKVIQFSSNESFLKITDNSFSRKLYYPYDSIEINKRDYFIEKIENLKEKYYKDLKYEIIVNDHFSIIKVDLNNIYLDINFNNNGTQITWISYFLKTNNILDNKILFEKYFYMFENVIYHHFFQTQKLFWLDKYKNKWYYKNLEKSNIFSLESDYLYTDYYTSYNNLDAFNPNKILVFLWDKEEEIKINFKNIDYFFDNSNYNVEIIEWKDLLKVVNIDSWDDKLFLKNIKDEKYIWDNKILLKITNDKWDSIIYDKWIIHIMKPILLVSWELWPNGWDITNDWKDIHINVKKWIFDKNYKIDYIWAMDYYEWNCKIKKVIFPKLSKNLINEINVTQYPYDMIMHNYLYITDYTKYFNFK